MFASYARSAFRTLWKNTLFSLINILGLAIGLAAGILIMLFVRYELSYESWLPNADEVYRVSSVWKNDGNPSGQGAWVPGPFRQMLYDEFPEVDAVTRVSERRLTFKRGDALFSELLSRADPEFFDVFDMPIVAGDAGLVLQSKNTMAISQALAEKYFGQEDPIGQMITVNGDTDYRVVAVFADIPENAEVSFDAIGLFDVVGIQGRHYFDDWYSTTLQTYFTVKDGADVDQMFSRIDDITNRIVPDETPETPYADNQSFVALPLSKAHLFGTTGDDYMPGGGFKTVVTFAVVAFLVVGVAVFNFVNSSTAIAQLRAKEVALRKTMGAGRRQLVQQFLAESTTIVVLAFAVAFLLVELLMPAFRDFWDKPIQANYFTDPLLLGALLILFPLVSLGAGYYPAIYLTRFRPAKTLTSNKSNRSEKAGMRKIMVLAQFSVSIGLAIMATLIHMQFEYATSRDLGFDRENKLILRGIGTDAVEPRYAALKAEIARLPGVRSITRSYYVIGDGNQSSRSVTADWLDETPRAARIAPVDFGYFDLYGVPLIAGRTFDEQFANDVFVPLEVGEEESTVDGTAIINRTALKLFGFSSPEEALGKTFYMGIDDGLSRGAFQVVGVVEDFKERNVRESVRSTVYLNYVEYFSAAHVALNAGSMPTVLGQIEEIWKRVVPDVPIRYQFLDEKLDRMYSPAKRRAQMLFAFSGLAILISALGLYGLASFTVVRRTKEVGIRKVMGASSLRITGLLIRQFSTPVLLANLIAWPTAWYLAQDWLESFAYRIDIDPFIFLAYGAGALALSWLTVGGHAWKVARSNPVKALRYE